MFNQSTQAGSHSQNPSTLNQTQMLQAQTHIGLFEDKNPLKPDLLLQKSNESAISVPSEDMKEAMLKRKAEFVDYQKFLRIRQDEAKHKTDYFE